MLLPLITYQPILSRSREGHSKVTTILIQSFDFNAQVGFGLFEPVLQHGLHIDALPNAGAGAHVELQGSDSRVPRPVFHGPHEPQDLHKHRRGRLDGSQVDPQLGLYDFIELYFRAELKEAAFGFAFHLRQKIS